MKVCIWKLGPHVGGTEISMIELGGFLKRENKDCVVDIYADVGSQAETFAKKFGFTLCDYSKITSNYDVLLLYAGGAAVRKYQNILNRIPVRISVFGGYVRDLINGVATKVIAKDRHIKDWLEKVSPYKDIKVSQFPIDLDYWKRSSGDPVVVTTTYVGRACQTKNLADIIRLTRGLPCDVRLVLQDLDLKNNNMELLSGNNVKFVHNSLDVINEYETSSIFMMTSIQEGVSRSLMEAMAMSLPVVVFNVGGMGLLNPKYMFAPGTDIEIKSALERLCSSSNLREDVGMVNRKNIELFNSFVESDLREYFQTLS